MPLKTHKVESQLKSKFGFSQSEGRSSDHRWYELKLPNLPIIATKISHGMDTLSSNLEGKISRQLRVKKKFFIGMISCSNNLDAYKKQVEDDPTPPFNVMF